MKHVFLTTLFAIFSAIIVDADERIAGWNQFYFNMSKNEAETILGMLCEETDFDSDYNILSEGKDCGSTYGETFDITLSHHRINWWDINKKLVHIYLKIEYEEHIYKRIYKTLEQKWGIHHEYKCHEITNKCHVSFTSHNEIHLYKPFKSSNKDKKISIMYRSIETFR